MIPGLVSHELRFSRLNGEDDFEPGSLGFGRNKIKTGNERGRGPNKALLKEFVVWSWIFSGTRPSY